MIGKLRRGAVKDRHWIRKLGLFAFLFFLVKGLLWFLVPLFLLFWGFLGF